MVHSTKSEAVTVINNEARQLIVAAVLDSVTSPHTKRAYARAINDFVDWFMAQGAATLNKAAVQRYRADLIEQGMGASSINQRLCAIRKLAHEATDNGALEPVLAQGIANVKSVKQQGQRLGNWLSEEETRRLLAAPDLGTLKGVRDRALLAFLVGCGLRRSEIVALTFSTIARRAGRWMIVDLTGKHGRVRSIPIPRFAKAALDEYVKAAGILDTGYVFRSVNRWDQLANSHLCAQAVRRIVKHYGEVIGKPELAPHDLRRTCAKLMRRKGAELEQIQTILGHASIETTMKYLGPPDEFASPLDDFI